MPRTGSLAGRTGFTLVETVVAVATSSILLLALGSVITIAARAIPSGNEPVVRATQIERGLATLLADFEEATDYQWTDDDQLLNLGVPDRNGDGVDELIQYTANESDQFVRILNGGAPYALFDGVIDFVVDHTKEGDLVSWAEIKLQLRQADPNVRVLRVRLLNMPEER